MSEKDNSVPPLSFEIERQARIKRSLVIQDLRSRHRARVCGMAPQSRAKHPAGAPPNL